MKAVEHNFLCMCVCVLGIYLCACVWRCNSHRSGLDKFNCPASRMMVDLLLSVEHTAAAAAKK